MDSSVLKFPKLVIKMIESALTPQEPPLPDGVGYLEEQVISVDHAMIDRANERSLAGVSARVRQMAERVLKERRLTAEVYSVDGVEFKLIRIPYHPLAMGQTHVTQALWRAVTGDNPSHFRGDQRPVEQVSWGDCVAFCNQLSERVGLDPVYRGEGNQCELIPHANGFRLPFEAEWQFAARANHKIKTWPQDLDEAYLDATAWFDLNSNKETHPVAQKRPNDFNLYDTIGNAVQWCVDDYHDSGTHQPGAELRVGRGSGWWFNNRCCDQELRQGCKPDYSKNHIGLRLSRALGSIEDRPLGSIIDPNEIKRGRAS